MKGRTERLETETRKIDNVHRYTIDLRSVMI